MSRSLTFGAALLSALLLGSGVAVADDSPAPPGSTSPTPEAPAAGGGVPVTEDEPAPPAEPLPPVEPPPPAEPEPPLIPDPPVVPAPAEPPAPSGPVRILITGDSLAQGYNGDYTWRYRLAKEFARQRVPVDFVGSLKLPFIATGFTTSRYYDPKFDSDHYARVGGQLKSLLTSVEAEVTQQQPDVIVLSAGLNDLLNDASPAETARRLGVWITNARAAKPDVRLILSPVLTIDRANLPEVNADVRAYNRLLSVTASTRNTLLSPITVADTDRDWKPTDARYSIDGVHPAPTGETIIAQRIGETMNRVGLLPKAAKIARVVQWTRVLKPRVTFVGRRATITWDGHQINGATVYSRRKGSSIYRYHSGGKAHANVMAGTQYTFRLRLKRQRAVGPWGPALVVTTPRR